ncbi:MAG TPA: hypothetical protein VNM38_11850 [Solirubrobacterales bacterium]|nr:hypothetical protein [Solirubrobacterales bacterium]
MERSCGIGRKLGGWVVVAAAAAAVVLLVKGLYPANLPRSASLDFVDNVFDNRGVLWAARLLLVYADRDDDEDREDTAKLRHVSIWKRSSTTS